ncbi:Integrase core domain [Phytophthora infestans]|uniref:Integrase core domain n=1 Tax=Phytophthora infestans TaxID=4787 RepID=A0A8S9UTI6_PHYIN|nr:Integrase core domain [Phytophthora infestans]
MATTREMWRSFIQDKTKRAYVSEIRLRSKMDSTKFTTGEDMEKYLEKLEDMRRQSANMNAVITDEEMARIILQSVVDSHRNVARLFGRTDGGAPPDLATVPGVLGDTNNPPVPIRMTWSQNDSCLQKHKIYDWVLDSGAEARNYLGLVTIGCFLLDEGMSSAGGFFNDGSSVETLEVNIVMKWHLKLAHWNEAALKKMVKEGLADGMSGLSLDDLKRTPLKCIACEEAKAKRTSFKRQQGKRATKCGARLMFDVRYIKTFSCDQGEEFLNGKLTSFLSEHGIRLMTTNAYTPEENGLVEKLNGKLLSKLRAIRDAANLPQCLWGKILHYVVHVDNMSLTKALGSMTPYQRLYKKKLDMKDIKICGCVAYHRLPKATRGNKLEMRAKPAVFLGIAEESLGYRLPDLGTGDHSA